MLKNTEKSAGKFLRYCSILEEETFQLYVNLARKTEYADNEAILIGLAYDCFKHSRIVRELSKYLTNPSLQVKDPRQELGLLWEQTHEFSTEIYRKTQIDTDEFSNLLKSLANLEDLISQAYTALTETKTLQFLTSEISKLSIVNYETLKGTFENIVRDKEKHRDTLIEIMYYLAAKEIEQTKDNPPQVKYQNPDRWSTPAQA
jgi:rubrerythrin